MKCQKCPKAATLHITEILGEEQFEELHMCEECAHKYLYEPQKSLPKSSSATPVAAEEGDETVVRRITDFVEWLDRTPDLRVAEPPPEYRPFPVEGFLVVCSGEAHIREYLRERPGTDASLRTFWDTLGVDATNTTGAHLLYQRLGFTVTREQLMYRKELTV